MSLSVIPLTILGHITGVSGSGDTVLYQVSFKSIDGTSLYGVTAVWTDEQAEIEALAAQKPYGVWINPIDGTFTVKFAGYTYVGSADLTDPDVLAGVTPIEFTTTEVSDRLLPEVTAEDDGKILQVDDGQWQAKSADDLLTRKMQITISAAELYSLMSTGKLSNIYLDITDQAALIGLNMDNANLYKIELMLPDNSIVPMTSVGNSKSSVGTSSNPTYEGYFFTNYSTLTALVVAYATISTSNDKLLFELLCASVTTTPGFHT